MSGIYTVLIFFTSFTFSLIIVPLMIYLAKKKQIYDLPDKGDLSISEFAEGNISFTKSRRIHSQPIPRLGGVAIVAGFFISVSIWKLPSNMALIFCCSFVMFSLGLVDDIITLSAKVKLFIQTITVLIVVFFSNLQIQNITLSNDLTFTIPYIFGVFLSTFIIIGAINSINMVDGLDGLAGGIVLIGISLLSYLHFLSTHNFNLIIVFSIPILGAILGFLKYNTHPSSIFMGDSGSNWLGFMIGVFLILILKNITVSEHSSGWILENSTKLNYFPILSVILCLSIPIFDTAHVIILRLIEGKNPLKADTRHFHHSLIKMGFTHAQSVIIVYFLMIFFGILGILPIAYPHYNLNWTPIVGILLSIFCIVFSVKLSDGYITQLSSYKFFLVSKSTASPKISLIFNYWEHINRYTIYLILLATPFLAGVVPKSISIVAACMAIILIFTIFIKRSDSFFESFLIAIASTVLLIANNINVIWIEVLGTKYNLQHAYNNLFIWLLLSTVFFFILTFKRKYLIIAPTDFLLAILPLALLLLPIEYQEEYKLNIIALRSLVLFAALRTLSKRHSRFFYKVHFICIIALAWIALTTLVGLRFVY